MKKKIYIIATFTILCSILVAQINWEAYTNTTHIFDAALVDNQIYLASWGGVAIYDIHSDEFVQTYTTSDGLNENEIRALSFLEDSDQLMIATRNNGINRIVNGNLEISVPIDYRINAVTASDDLIFIATDEGVGVYAQIENWPIPVLLKSLNTDNGLTFANVTSIEISGDEYLLCGSDNGLDFAHIDSLDILDSWHHLDDSVLPGLKINSISTNADYVCIATESGLVLTDDLINLTAWDVYDDDKSIFPVFIDSENNIFYSYGVWDESLLSIQDDESVAIKKISPDESVTVWTSNEIGTNKIYRFKEFNNSVYALSWGKGFFKYTEGTWQNRKPNTVISSVIKDIKIDNEDKVWVTNGHKGHLATTKGTKGVSGFKNGIWENFNTADTPLHSNNIYSLSIDYMNRKWFGSWNSNSTEGWSGGISVFDETNNSWEYFNSGTGLSNNTISFITQDEADNTWICCYGGSSGAIDILDSEHDLIHSFDLYDADLRDPNYVFFSEDKIYLGAWISGLRIWNDTSFPENNSPVWEDSLVNDLKNCQIYDIVSLLGNSGEQIWVAASTGLFQYAWHSAVNNKPAGYFWFKYGTVLKKQIHTGSWYPGDNQETSNPEYRYYEDQERLYGAVPTYPTALLVDPFDRLWIGTQENGITMYDQNSDKYTNFTMDNSPLISNTITDLAYDAVNGKMYIGTNDGMNTVEIGIAGSSNTQSKLNETIAYPNPFSPEKGESIHIENTNAVTMPKGKTTCTIYDLNGKLVIKLDKDIYQQFTWNGKNGFDKKCSSGIYLYVVSSSIGEIARGKIGLIR